jgi:hypothetical protein
VEFARRVGVDEASELLIVASLGMFVSRRCRVPPVLVCRRQAPALAYNETAPLCSSRAFAEDGFGVLSGNKLFDFCQKEPNSCGMFIAGVSDVLLLAHVVCAPGKMSRGQTVDLVVNVTDLGGGVTTGILGCS